MSTGRCLEHVVRFDAAMLLRTIYGLRGEAVMMELMLYPACFGALMRINHSLNTVI